MSTHPMADIQTRRETLLDSINVLAGPFKGLVKLDIHALLLEIFEGTDAMRRTAECHERIARALEKLVSAPQAQPELPLRSTTGLPPADALQIPIVPLGLT